MDAPGTPAKEGGGPGGGPGGGGPGGGALTRGLRAPDIPAAEEIAGALLAGGAAAVLPSVRSRDCRASEPNGARGGAAPLAPAAEMLALEVAKGILRPAVGS